MGSSAAHLDRVPIDVTARTDTCSAALRPQLLFDFENGCLKKQDLDSVAYTTVEILQSTVKKSPRTKYFRENRKHFHMEMSRRIFPVVVVFLTHRQNLGFESSFRVVGESETRARSDNGGQANDRHHRRQGEQRSARRSCEEQQGNPSAPATGEASVEAARARARS